MTPGVTPEADTWSRVLDELLVEPGEGAQRVAVAAVRRMELEKSNAVASGGCIRMCHSGGYLHPGARGGSSLVSVERDGDLAGEHVDRLDMVGVDVRRVGLRTGLAPYLGETQLLQVGKELDMPAGSFHDVLDAADGGLARRTAAVLGRRMLVVGERAAVPHRAQILGEALSWCVEVEVADFRVGSVAEAVDDEGRYSRERSRRHREWLVRASETHGQLALEDVEAIGVVAMDVEVGALAPRPEARPRRVQRLAVGENLDAPVGRVADHLPGAGWYDDGLGHA